MKVKELKALLEFHDEENDIVVIDAQARFFRISEAWNSSDMPQSFISIGEQI